MNTKEELIKKLQQFRESAYQLSYAWEQHEFQHTDSSLLTENYPFNMSFDELALEISQWVETSIESLQKNN